MGLRRRAPRPIASRNFILTWHFGRRFSRTAAHFMARRSRLPCTNDRWHQVAHAGDIHRHPRPPSKARPKRVQGRSRSSISGSRIQNLAMSSRPLASVQVRWIHCECRSLHFFPVGLGAPISVRRPRSSVASRSRIVRPFDKVETTAVARGTDDGQLLQKFRR